MGHQFLRPSLDSPLAFINTFLIMALSSCGATAALFVFTTQEAAERFVAEDPYVSNGIVTGHSIAEWSVVVGDN